MCVFEVYLDLVHTKPKQAWVSGGEGGEGAPHHGAVLRNLLLRAESGYRLGDRGVVHAPLDDACSPALGPNCPSGRHCVLVYLGERGWLG